MNRDDEYFTIDRTEQAEIKIKGSRFIGTAFPIKNEDHAKKILEEISKKYYDATHNCYAYIVDFPPHQIIKVSDDGEPAGTAGQPILSVLQGMNLNFVGVVVTRYFGGTKLGKGGLIRAYTECTQEVLKKCPIVKKVIQKEITVSFAYDLTGAVMNTISQFGATLINSSYDDETRLKISVRSSELEKFKRQLIDVTSGKVRLSGDSDDS